MRINKKYLILNIIIAAAVIFVVVYSAAVGGHLTLHTNSFFENAELTGFHAEYENEGVVEVTNVYLAGDGELIIEYQALGKGNADVNVNSELKYGNGNVLKNKNSNQLKVTQFGVIFDEQHNFQGYSVMLYTVMLLLLLIIVFLATSFFSYWRSGDFNYNMIACIGVTIFCSVLFAFLLYKLINNGIRFFQEFLRAFLNIGEEIFLLIVPIMLVMSLMLAVSNIWLIRNEGFRPVNALGIVFGLLWAAAMILSFWGSVIPVIRNMKNPSLFERSVLYLSCYFGAMFIATVICAYLATKYRPPYDRDYIIILGCGICEDGTLTPLLKGRVDAALQFEKEQFEKTGKHAIFVPSGGQGPDEVISESQAMTNYLIEQGVERDRILMEDKSVNTMQNMQFSGEVIRNNCEDFENCKIAFATTNYHVFRGYILAKKNGFSAQGISAKTKRYFYFNAFLREFIGLLVDQKFNHIAFVVLTLAVFVLSNHFSAG